MAFDGWEAYHYGSKSYEIETKNEINRIIGNDQKLEYLVACCYNLVKNYKLNKHIWTYVSDIVINTKQFHKFRKIIGELSCSYIGSYRYWFDIREKETCVGSYAGGKKYKYTVGIVLSDIYLVTGNSLNMLPPSSTRFQSALLYSSLKSPIFEPRVLRIIQKLAGPRRLKIIHH